MHGEYHLSGCFAFLSVVFLEWHLTFFRGVFFLKFSRTSVLRRPWADWPKWAYYRGDLNIESSVLSILAKHRPQESSTVVALRVPYCTQVRKLQYRTAWYWPVGRQSWHWINPNLNLWMWAGALFKNSSIFPPCACILRLKSCIQSLKMGPVIQAFLLAAHVTGRRSWHGFLWLFWTLSTNQAHVLSRKSSARLRSDITIVHGLD